MGKPRNKYKQKISILELFLIITTSIIVLCLYQFVLSKVCIFFDRTRLNRPYTYKIGNVDPEYVTCERIGNTRYKIYFHSSPENPRTDYIITTSKHSKAYPPLWWCYIEGEDNQVCLDISDFGAFWIDTIVSRNYEFEAAHYLLRKDTIVSYKDYERLKEKQDSLEPKHFRLEVFTQNFSILQYSDPHETKSRKLKTADIVRHD